MNKDMKLQHFLNEYGTLLTPTTPTCPTCPTSNKVIWSN